MKLNLGAGKRRLEGYISVDLDKNADVQLDVRNLSVYQDNSIEEIIAVHLIEHFYYWEVNPLLQEWRRVLVPGGKLILECPDLEKACFAFIRGDNPRMSLWPMYGDPVHQNELMCHHWGYTPKSLEEELVMAGFRSIKHTKAQFKIPERDMRVEAEK